MEKNKISNGYSATYTFTAKFKPLKGLLPNWLLKVYLNEPPKKKRSNPSVT